MKPLSLPNGVSFKIFAGYLFHLFIITTKYVRVSLNSFQCRYISSGKKQKEYFLRLAQEREGKSIIFYGAGDLYERNKHYFFGCKSSAMLLDKEYIQDRTEVDHLPVLPVERIGELDETAPIVIFSTMATMLQRNLERKHSSNKKRIHTCTVPLEMLHTTASELSL